ncbi:MAG: polysaccharide biosynthesis protein [Gemmatimonadota bacterium]
MAELPIPRFPIRPGTLPGVSAIASHAHFPRPPVDPILRYRRLIIIGLHVALIPLAYGLAFLLRFEWPIPEHYIRVFWMTLPLLAVLRLGMFAMFRLYNGWWRYVGMYDLTALLKAVSFSSLLFAAALFLTGQIRGFPRSVFVLDWGIAIACFGGIRFTVRWLREGNVRKALSIQGKRTLIVGAGEIATQLLRHVRIDSSCEIRPIGLVDDDPMKRSAQLKGVPVLGTTEDLARLVTEHRIKLLIVAMASPSRETMRKIAESCAGLDVELKIVPSLRHLLAGKYRLDQLHAVGVEDLLGRPSVNLDLKRVERDLRGKIVLITGAAGSIGSELARQIAALRPVQLILLEQAESPLYQIHLELTAAYPDLEVLPVIADVTDARRIDRVFAKHLPEYVFHAAAYKHVPLMERNASEAVRNNVMGTFRLATCATRHGVDKFVLISTDKAVRPASIMGASKRLSERIVLGWPEFRSSGTDFRAVRFGNVLGSTGSVIPLFERQIASGGPVTVTHPGMMRYFLTIPEAVQLVLQAAALPELVGRISILDMGEPVRILEMAENLIRLKGLEPYAEMPIVFTGIRSGEKLHEDLMSEVERAIPTAVEKIRIVQTNEADGEVIRAGLIELEAALLDGDENRLIRVLCDLVPESVPPLSERGKYPTVRSSQSGDSQVHAVVE